MFAKYVRVVYCLFPRLVYVIVSNIAWFWKTSFHPASVCLFIQWTKYLLCTQVIFLEHQRPTTFKLSIEWQFQLPSDDHHKDTLWVRVQELVTNLDESESGQMVLEEVKWTYSDVYLSPMMWNHATKSMKMLEWSTSVFLQGDVGHIGSSLLKTWKTGETKSSVSQYFQILWTLSMCPKKTQFRR